MAKRFQTGLHRVWNHFNPHDSKVLTYHNQGVQQRISVKIHTQLLISFYQKLKTSETPQKIVNSALNFWQLPEWTRGQPGDQLSVRIRSIEKIEVGSFILHKMSYCFGICTLLKQYHCYESLAIRYTDQYLAQYSEISNNIEGISLIFCHSAVRRVGLDVRDRVNSHIMCCWF